MLFSFFLYMLFFIGSLPPFFLLHCIFLLLCKRLCLVHLPLLHITWLTYYLCIYCALNVTTVVDPVLQFLAEWQTKINLLPVCVTEKCEVTICHIKCEIVTDSGKGHHFCPRIGAYPREQQTSDQFGFDLPFSLCHFLTK